MNKENIIVLIIFILLIGGTIGVIIYSKQRDSKKFFIYEGKNGEYRIDIFTTGNQTDYYVYAVTEDQVYLTPLRRTPQDVEAIPLEDNLLTHLNARGISKVYITQDYETPNKTGQLSFIAIQDIGKILGTATYGIYKLDVQGALTTTSNRSLELDIPQITCLNATASTGVIYIKLGNENKVYSKDRCVIVEGRDADGLILAANKFAYYLLGVF